MKTFLFLLALACLSGTLRAQLVENGSFETGDLTDWTLLLGGPPANTGVLQSGQAANAFPSPYVPYAAEDGDYYAAFGQLAPNTDSISQAITTTIGDHYQLSYYLINNGSSPNEFSVSLNGLSTTEVNVPNQPWTEYTVNFTASSTSTLLAFAGFDDPSVLGLDNIVLTDTSTDPAVPEPSTWAMLLGGLGLLVWRLRAKSA